MESTLTRNEKIFITIGLTTVVAFLVLFSKLNKRPTDLSHYATSEVINYQMVRAEEGYAGYSLDGREIDDQYQGLKTKKLNQAAQLLKPVAKATVKTVAKPVSVAKASQTNAQVTMTANTNNVNKTNAVASAKSATTATSNDPAIAPYTPPASTQIEPSASAQNDSTTKDKSKAKKSYSQWRQEIFAKASKEAVSDFIAAYRRNELTATEYQAMAQDLLEQSNANLKGLGLMALRSQPSMASLSQLVHAEETTPAPALKAYIDQSYLAYVQPQNVQYLNQALQTQDRKLILKSLSLLSVNIPKIKSGDVSVLLDSRHLRSGESADLTLGSFQQLLPSLNLIGSAQVPEISTLAQQVVSLIKSTKVAGL